MCDDIAKKKQQLLCISGLTLQHAQLHDTKKISNKKSHPSYICSIYHIRTNIKGERDIRVDAHCPHLIESSSNPNLDVKKIAEAMRMREWVKVSHNVSMS